jgi:peroxin-2
LASLASFLVFLYNGRYRTLIDRFLRLRLTPPTSQVSREVSFEYLNRQLVWHAFTEFLLFVLPLVGIGRWRRWLSRVWRKTKTIIRSGDEQPGQAGAKLAGELAFLPERTCAICYQDQNPANQSETDVLAVSGAAGGVIGSAQTDVTNPYECIPCGCIYCFVCIAQRLEAEEGEGWVCLKCGELVKECKPWNGDVYVETSRPGTASKTVVFSDDSDKEREKEKEMREIEPRAEEEDDEVEVDEELEGEDEESNEDGGWAKASQEIDDEDEGEEEEDEEASEVDSREGSGSEY